MLGFVPAQANVRLGAVLHKNQIGYTSTGWLKTEPVQTRPVGLSVNFRVTRTRTGTRVCVNACHRYYWISRFRHPYTRTRTRTRVCVYVPLRLVEYFREHLLDEHLTTQITDLYITNSREICCEIVICILCAEVVLFCWNLWSKWVTKTSILISFEVKWFAIQYVSRWIMVHAVKHY